MKLYRKKVKFLIGVIIIVLVIFLLNVFSKNVRSFFYSISSPMSKALWATGNRTSDFFEAVIKTSSLKKEADELKYKNQELLAKIIVLEESRKENEILRTALRIELQKDFKLILAQISGKDISQDFILVDKGLNDGISEGMPVITQQKVLLGKVYEVYKNFSKIMLISNRKSSFDAEIKEKDISAIVRGKGNLKVFLDLVPRDKEISQEDIIITTSLGGVFPSGLLVGKIAEIKKDDIESFQQAEVKSAFDIKDVNYLFIITKY